MYIHCMRILSQIIVLIVLIQTVNGVKIGIICETKPTSWQFLFGIAGAINIAMDKLVEDGIIHNDTVERYSLL